jgi:hypothetical protein
MWSWFDFLKLKSMNVVLTKLWIKQKEFFLKWFECGFFKQFTNLCGIPRFDCFIEIEEFNLNELVLLKYFQLFVFLMEK